MIDESTAKGTEETVVVRRRGPNRGSFQKKPKSHGVNTAQTADTETPLRVNDRRDELNPVDPQGRPERIPVGQQNRLAFPKRKGYVRRVVNDVNDGERIKMFERAGYTRVAGIVPGGDTRAGADSQMGTGVVRSVGLGIKGVLMEIPEEFYKEDQALKDKATDETENAIVRKAEEHGLEGTVTLQRR